MNKGKMLSCATLLIPGFTGASFAQGESGGGMDRQGASDTTIGSAWSNPDKTTVLQLYEALWERQEPWREFIKWTFVFGAVVTVLSGVLYVSI